MSWRCLLTGHIPMRGLYLERVDGHAPVECERCGKPLPPRAVARGYAKRGQR